MSGRRHAARAPGPLARTLGALAVAALLGPLARAADPAPVKVVYHLTQGLEEETRKIDRSKLLPEATLVPSGVAEVARLQSREGFGYLRP